MEHLPNSIAESKSISLVEANNIQREEIKRELEYARAQLKELKLPKGRGFITDELKLYQGFWCPSPNVLSSVMAFQNHFQAQDTDIIIATKPKSGTTWLKSLVYSVLHRTHFTTKNHPLLEKNPHELAPFFELNIYVDEEKQLPTLLTHMSNLPRLFGTHVPYDSLSRSIKDDDSKCRIVYMARNPFDAFISSWKFAIHNSPTKNEQEISIEDYLGLYCKGVDWFGPFWDHVLGYWKQSLEMPNKVLFLKYEDMKENGVFEMKKLAEFLGCGFSSEEEKQGVIDDILKLCSLSNLKELEVNKTGRFIARVENKSYFRKGEVGDWVNYFSPSMVEKLDQVIKEKFAGYGLEFKLNASSKKS